MLEKTKMKQDLPAVGFVSLGCPKALVDSERILSQLRAEGYVVSPTYQDADLVLVNTCGFIESAVQESLEAIGEAIQENGKVIVTGCLGAREDVIRAAHPKVLDVTGPQNYEAVMRAVHKHLPKPHDPRFDLIPEQGIKLTPKHYAYLKISEGCNHRCRFCIIPSMRGDLVSRPLLDVLIEAEKLFKSGVKELLIISQDTSAYGVDRRYEKTTWCEKEYATNFQGLCESLSVLAEQYDAWVRLHYVYPYPHVIEALPLMANQRLLPYLDIPFQHGSPSVLKRMKRPAHAEKTLERIAEWRAICPNLVIRSTFIVGFPGETEAEFQELLDFLRIAQLDRVGCFEYSPVAGAEANLLPNPVPDAIKAVRHQQFMELAAEISAQKLSKRIGCTMDVLIDAVEEDGSGYIGRSYADAPEIDGNVFVRSRKKLRAGMRVAVKIDDADAYDLYGRA